jgi:hypothetical protein
VGHVLRPRQWLTLHSGKPGLIHRFVERVKGECLGSAQIDHSAPKANTEKAAVGITSVDCTATDAACDANAEGCKASGCKASGCKEAASAPVS